MAPNLVICCDGTNNQFGSQNSSVVRLVQVLDRRAEYQQIYYDPGIGTLPEPGIYTRTFKKVSELSGLAFGTGMTQKVERAYSFLMDHWQPGSKVYLFGFSRGAFTVRVLAGLLHSLGLLSSGQHNLVPYAMRLFKSLRGNDGDDGKDSKYWRLSNEFRQTFARPVEDGETQKRFQIHFMGLWDTVSSVGWVWEPATFPYTAKNPSVRCVRHAVAIDERRWFFRQNLLKAAEGQDFEEMWFPGVHSDVGGGYPVNESGLWQIPFDWIVRYSAMADLKFNELRLAAMREAAPADDRAWAEPQHESLTAKWWPWEFFPKRPWKAGGRRWPTCGRGRPRFIPDGSLIHDSAVRRIRELNYSPANFSSEFVSKIRELAEVSEAVPFHRY